MKKDNTVTKSNPMDTDTTNTNSEIVGLESVVKKLMDKAIAVPDNLAKITSASAEHKLLIERLDDHIKTISLILKPLAEDAEAKVDSGKKISVADRAIFLYQKKSLISLKRKLKSSLKSIESRIKRIARSNSKQVRLYDLRDKVKQPNYYKKYGKNIVPSFSKWLTKPMTEELFNSLKAIRSNNNRSDFDKSLRRLLLTNEPSIYIRATGNAELKDGYFSDFRKILKSWNPTKANIKKSLIE